MNALDKMGFVVENLTGVMNSYVKKFKKANKKMLKSLEDSMDYETTNDIMAEALVETVKIMDEWQDTSLSKLDGLTPKQYFESLSSFDEIIELYALLEEKNSGLLPNGLVERVRSLEDKIAGDLLGVLNSMDLGESKCLNPAQMADVRMIETLGDPQFIQPLLKVVNQLDDEKSDEDTFTAVMDAMRAIGEPVLDSLIGLVEGEIKNNRLYNYLMLTIGKIASSNKTEQVYSFIKNHFRKSEKKYIEATALAIYGDGRAIPAIRGYVEKNLEDLPYWEYLQYREAILLLGGNVSDIDEYFDEYDEYDDFEEF